MNSQRVNFYHPRFYPQRPFLPLKTVLRAWLLLLCSLLGGHWFLQAHLGEREAMWAEQRAHLEGVVSAADERGAGVLHACQMAWKEVEQKQFRPNPRPVAPLLEQLATSHVSALWLTKIEISEGGEQVVIQGHIPAQHSPQLPHYLERLARQPAMAGRDLRDFQLEKEPLAAFKGSLPAVTAEQSLLKFRVTFGKEAKP